MGTSVNNICTLENCIFPGFDCPQKHFKSNDSSFCELEQKHSISHHFYPAWQTVPRQKHRFEANSENKLFIV